MLVEFYKLGKKSLKYMFLVIRKKLIKGIISRVKIKEVGGSYVGL